MATSPYSSRLNPPLPPPRGTRAAALPSKKLDLYCMCDSSDPFIKELQDRLPKTTGATRFKEIRLYIATYGDKKNSSEVLGLDMLIFPNMIKYKGITASDIECFVEEVIIVGKEWTSKKPGKLAGVHVFVSANSVGCDSKTLLSNIFTNEVAARQLDQIIVSNCTLIYGNMYFGNVVVYTPDFGRGKDPSYCWYDQVQEEDIPFLLDEYFCKGKPIAFDWRTSRPVQQPNGKAQTGNDLQQYAEAKASFASDRVQKNVTWTTDLAADQKTYKQAEEANGKVSSGIDLQQAEAKASFASRVKKNVPWTTLAGLGAMAALYGFSLSRTSK